MRILWIKHEYSTFLVNKITIKFFLPITSRSTLQLPLSSGSQIVAPVKFMA